MLDDSEKPPAGTAHSLTGGSPVARQPQGYIAVAFTIVLESILLAIIVSSFERIKLPDRCTQLDTGTLSGNLRARLPIPISSKAQRRVSRLNRGNQPNWPPRTRPPIAPATSHQTRTTSRTTSTPRLLTNTIPRAWRAPVVSSGPGSRFEEKRVASSPYVPRRKSSITLTLEERNGIQHNRSPTPRPATSVKLPASLRSSKGRRRFRHRKTRRALSRQSLDCKQSTQPLISLPSSLRPSIPPR